MSLLHSSPISNRSLSTSFTSLIFIFVATACNSFCALAWSPVGREVNSPTTTSRRNFLSSQVSAAAVISGVTSSSLISSPAFASEALQLTPFVDNVHRFSISAPSSWIKTEQTLPDRRNIIIFTDPKDNKNLMFIAYTPVRDDFTSLGSMGTVDQVAQMTILPKGKLAGVDNESEMLSAESKKQAYFFDYRQKVEGQPQTHFRTIFTLIQGATGGAGAVLATITVQAPESAYKETLKPIFDDIIDSYKVVSP